MSSDNGRSNLPIYMTALVLVLVAVGGVGFWWFHVHDAPKQLSGVELSANVDIWMHRHGEPQTATATCPDVKAKTDYRFLCQVTGSHDVSGVAVTVLNGTGDVLYTSIAK